VKTYLVTGAAGFIGSGVAARLLERGDAVVGIDNLNDFYSGALKEERLQDLLVRPSFQFHKVDIENFADVAALFEKYRFQAVYNLAARAGVRYSLENPWVYMRTNADGTLNLLEAMKRHSVPKMILASTSSLYAGLPMPFREDSPVNTPISPYAASKKAAEVMAYTYHRQYGLDISVLRYFTVFGPAGRPDMAPYRFIENVREGLPVTVYGDGSQTRDFTFVDDICRGTLLAEKPLGYEIVNLGGGNTPVSLSRFLGWIETLVGRRAIVEHQPSHGADMRDTMADISKARSLLDWNPEVSTWEGLRRTVDWHLRSECSLRFAS
jgi:nucleoside-diphosphate-sugar epimerase